MLSRTQKQEKLNYVQELSPAHLSTGITALSRACLPQQQRLMVN